eukprot:6200014-Pleurochrysis_carterae.AAC.1
MVPACACMYGRANCAMRCLHVSLRVRVRVRVCDHARARPSPHAHAPAPAPAPAPACERGSGSSCTGAACAPSAKLCPHRPAFRRARAVLSLPERLPHAFRLLSLFFARVRRPLDALGRAPFHLRPRRR